MVAIKAHEAERTLASPPKGIDLFLFYGPDHGLISERAEHLARSSVTDPGDPFLLVRLDGGSLASDPMRLVDEADTIGLFGGRRAIWVSVGTKFPLSAIEPLLAKPPQDTTIVLEAGDLARNNALRLAIERSKNGLAIPCYGDEAKALDAVIDSILREHRITIDRDARQYLVNRLGLDRRVSRNEIEKLATYVGEGGTADTSAVEAIVGDAAARDIEDIVDGVFSGAIRDVDQAYQRLSSSGEDAGVLLGFVTRHAQALLLARHGIDAKSMTIADAAAGMRGVTYPRRKSIELALVRWTSADLVKAMTILHGALAMVRLHAGLADEMASRVLWNLALSGGKSTARGR
jgi:DNA polymerase III subunit delta